MDKKLHELAEKYALDKHFTRMKGDHLVSRSEADFIAGALAGIDLAAKYLETQATSIFKEPMFTVYASVMKMHAEMLRSYRAEYEKERA